MDPPVPERNLKEHRERTIRALCEHFARDHLEVEAFEQRLDVAHRSRAVTDLDALLEDLPALQPQTPTRALDPTRLIGDPDYARDVVQRSGRAVRDAVRDTQTLLAVMGGVERRGQWKPARKNVVIALMGGADLDFREVELPPGETEVFVVCLMGGTDIIVPPDLPVDASGIAIMGGFAHASPPSRPEGGASRLRIHGFCLMGGVDINVRRPGESARDARIRQREEQRLARSRRRLKDSE